MESISVGERRNDRINRMTKEDVSKVLDRVRNWPLEQQELLARIATELEEQQTAPRAHLDAETRAAIAEGFAQIEHGEIATDEEVEAAFARFRK